MENRRQNTKFKRTEVLKFLLFFLAVLYAFLITFSTIFDLHLHRIWFSLALFFIGVFLVTKAIFFHLDSAMLFGLFALLFGVVSGLLSYFPTVYALEIYLGVISLSNLIVYFIFRQNFYLILFALLFLEVLLLVIFKIQLDLMLFWVFQSVYFFVTILIILRMTIFLKEK